MMKIKLTLLLHDLPQYSIEKQLDAGEKEKRTGAIWEIIGIYD